MTEVAATLSLLNEALATQLDTPEALALSAATPAAEPVASAGSKASASDPLANALDEQLERYDRLSCMLAGVLAVAGV